MLKNYVEVRKLLKETSRGQNPDWYLPAQKLNFQIHLVPESGGTKAYFYSQKDRKWFEQVSDFDLESDAETCSEFVAATREHVFQNEADSVGVILHLNREASIFEFHLPEESEEFSEQVISEQLRADPISILQDRTLEEQGLNFRLYPLPQFQKGEYTGCAIGMSRYGQDILKRFRDLSEELNFPIQTIGVSVPLHLFSVLPRLLPLKEGKPLCLLLNFELFSMFAVYSEVGELMKFRSVRHPGGMLPDNLEAMIRTTASAVELADYELGIVDCCPQGQGFGKEGFADLLLSHPFEFYSREDLELNSPIELAYLDEEVLALHDRFDESKSFGETLEGEWHRQDFLNPTQEEIDSRPGAVDFKVLRVTQLVSKVGIAALVLFGFFVGWSTFQRQRSEEWKYENDSRDVLGSLTQEVNRLEGLQKLLASRSRGWTSMELLMRLFPLDGSVRFKDADYSVSAIAGGRAGTSGAFAKTWRVSGLAKASATDSLVAMNTEEGVKKIFVDVYEATGDPAFDVNESGRKLTASLDLSENPDFGKVNKVGVKDVFSYQFKLEIVQEFLSKDPLAIPQTLVKR